MRLVDSDALEQRHFAPAPNFKANTASVALKHADILDRQHAHFALVTSAARAFDNLGLLTHNEIESDAKRVNDRYRAARDSVFIVTDMLFGCTRLSARAPAYSAAAIVSGSSAWRFHRPA